MAKILFCLVPKSSDETAIFTGYKISSAARRISPSRNADLHSGLSSIGKWNQENKWTHQWAVKKRQIKRTIWRLCRRISKGCRRILDQLSRILRKDWQSIVYEEVPVHPNAYFETFISVLRKTKRQRTPEVTAQMEYFAKTNDSSNQKSIYLFGSNIVAMVLQKGSSTAFLG